MSGRPARRRSAILSLVLVPLIVSTPCLSFGCLNLASLAGCEALSDLMGGAATPRPATIPAVPATTAATATVEAASRARRAVRDLLSRMSFFMVFLSELVDLSCAKDTGGRRLFPRRLVSPPKRHEQRSRSRAGIGSVEMGSLRA